MRIGVNARFLIMNKLEGLGWYTYHVLRNMVMNHPEHEYFFFFDRKPDPSFIFNNSITPIVLFPQARHPFLWYWWFEYSIPRALKKYKIDFFFSPDAYASLSTTIPQYLVIHDLAFVHYPEHVPFLVRKYYQHFSPKQISIAKHLFVVSNSVKQDLIKQFGISENKISIAYNGVRDEFKPLDTNEIKKIRDKYSRGKKYFLYVGAIHPRKNIANLILAFNQFKKYRSSDVLLLIVGRKAWLTEETDAAYQNSEYKDEIIFIPYCQTEDLARITAAAFYAINPSFLEGFGVPVLEALSCDIPVMVSNQFSLPEVAGPGAILFNPSDINEISSAMIQGLNDPEREQRIERGRIHRRQFNWEATSEIIYYGMIQNYRSVKI
jgi:glycosyltransferase involved in cell wall biosynthesis